MRKVSAKQTQEKLRRQEVYAILLETCPRDKWGERICVKCNLPLDWHWPGHEMHHLKPLSQGGKTSLENCQLWCAPCHQAETEHRER